MKNVANLTILLIFLTFSSTSCIKNVEFVEIESVNVGIENFDGVFTFFVKIYNPNSFRINIAESNIDIYMNNKYIGNLTTDNKIKIKAQKNSVIELPVKIKMVDFITNVPNALKILKSQEAVFKFEGTLVGKCCFAKKEIKINETKRLSFSTVRD